MQFVKLNVLVGDA